MAKIIVEESGFKKETMNPPFDSLIGVVYANLLVDLRNKYILANQEKQLSKIFDKFS